VRATLLSYSCFYIFILIALSHDYLVQVKNYDDLRSTAFLTGNEHTYFCITDKLSSTCYCYTALYFREWDFNEIDFIVSDTKDWLVVTLGLPDEYRQNHNDRADYEKLIPHTEDMLDILNSVVSLRFKRYYQEEPAE
jgi:hypothetical protein